MTFEVLRNVVLHTSEKREQAVITIIDRLSEITVCYCNYSYYYLAF